MFIDVSNITVADLLGMGDALLSIAIFLGAFFTYDLFVSHRRASSAVSGFAGGAITGAVIGGGAPIVVGGVGGAVTGFLLAWKHPRGGSVSVAMGAGISMGVLAAFALQTATTPSRLIATGLLVGAGLTAVSLRFPRLVILPGLAGVLGTIWFAGDWVHAGILAWQVNGPVVTDSPLLVEGGRVLVFVPATLVLFSLFTQPITVEFSDRVPPLMPSWLRGLLGASNAGYGVPVEVLPPCPNCGAIRDPGHDECPGCGERINASYDLDAEAVDTLCPICEKRPVEEMAFSRRMIGYGVGAKLPEERVVGCHKCVRDRLLKDAATSAVTGWWWLGGPMNAVYIVWNVTRALVNRGPTRKLLAYLEEWGVDADLLEDRDDFDPDAHWVSEIPP